MTHLGDISIDPYDELCGTCGLTFGAHRAGAPHPDQCPAHESYMDWDKGPGTTFVPTGRYASVPSGTPATPTTSASRQPGVQ